MTEHFFVVVVLFLFFKKVFQFKATNGANILSAQDKMSVFITLSEEGRLIILEELFLLLYLFSFRFFYIIHNKC